jgi:hypothetical protein
MDTHDARADHPRAQIGAIIIEAFRVLEAKLGMSVYEHAARVVKFPTKGERTARFRTNQPYCFKAKDGGGWLPLNRFYRPLGGLPRRRRV